MALLVLVYLLASSIQILESIKDIIVEQPFYLRAQNDQRTCQMYKFTIRRNHDYPYSMPEQDLTFWTNSLELKHLAVVGDYRVCGIICSEHLKQPRTYFDVFIKRNHSLTVITCVSFRAYRSHFLILTLYILVFIILAFSQIIFTLQKRIVQASIKTALTEVEHTLQKWHSAQTSSISTDHGPSYNILQSLITLPASPLEQSATTSKFHTIIGEQRLSHPVIFHLDTSNEHHEQLTLEIP